LTNLFSKLIQNFRRVALEFIAKMLQLITNHALWRTVRVNLGKARLSGRGLPSRILLQIHDELLVEVAPGETESVEALLKEQMGGAAELSVPLDVAVGQGRTWREAAH